MYQNIADSKPLEVDYPCCVCIEHLSVEERKHLENELELAQNIQRMQLPQEAPQIPGLEVFAYSRPSQIVGGDYFDFLSFENGSHGLLIADVAGHGVSSSLLVASLQTLLQALAPTSASPAAVIRQIHEWLVHNIRYSTFVSFFIGAYDPDTKMLTYCNAGHPPQLVIRDNKHSEDAMVLLKPTGVAIGLVENADFGESSVELKAGDTLVLYTDGVTETVNGHDQLYGWERLAAVVGQKDGVSAREMVGQIRQNLQEFNQGRPFSDDTTIVVGKMTQ